MATPWNQVVSWWSWWSWWSCHIMSYLGGFEMLRIIPSSFGLRFRTLRVSRVETGKPFPRGTLHGSLSTHGAMGRAACAACANPRGSWWFMFFMEFCCATENDMGVPQGLYGSMVSPECPTASIGMETTSWPFCLCPGCHQDFGEMPGKRYQACRKSCQKSFQICQSLSQDNCLNNIWQTTCKMFEHMSAYMCQDFSGYVRLYVRPEWMSKFMCQYIYIYVRRIYRLNTCQDECQNTCHHCCLNSCQA